MPYPTDRRAPTSISPLVSSIGDNRISPPGPTSRAPDRQTARIGAALSRRRLVREDYGEHVIENPVHQVIVLGDQGNRLNRHLGIPSVTCHAEVGYVREVIYDLRPSPRCRREERSVRYSKVVALFWNMCSERGERSCTTYSC